MHAPYEFSKQTVNKVIVHTFRSERAKWKLVSWCYSEMQALFELRSIRLTGFTVSHGTGHTNAKPWTMILYWDVRSTGALRTNSELHSRTNLWGTCLPCLSQWQLTTLKSGGGWKKIIDVVPEKRPNYSRTCIMWLPTGNGRVTAQYMLTA